MRYHWLLAWQAVYISVMDIAVNDKGSWYGYFHETCGLDKATAELRAMAVFLTPQREQGDIPARNNPIDYRMPVTPAYTAHNATEAASRKAKTRHAATPFGGIAYLTDRYQTDAMQRLGTWLAIGAKHGPNAFFAAVSQAGYLPYPPDSAAEHISMLADTGTLAIAANYDRTMQRATLRASTAIFTSLLEKQYLQPSADFFAVNVLRGMVKQDIRYVAASRGNETDVDRSTGVAPMAPRIATYCTWLLSSIVYICEQLHATSLDTIAMEQAEIWARLHNAEIAQIARNKKLAHEQHRLAGKWHDLVLKDPQIRKQERREAAQQRGKPSRYRHH